MKLSQRVPILAWIHTLKTFGRWWSDRKERKPQMLAQDEDDLIANVST